MAGLGVQDELKRMSYKDALNRDQSLSQELGFDLGQWLEDIRTTVAECRTAIMELIDDHAAFKTTVDESRTAIVELIDDHATAKAERDELHTWAEALATKLNADTGVADTDYDAEIAAATTGTLSAGDPTAGPATLTAGDPTAPPTSLA